MKLTLNFRSLGTENLKGKGKGFPAVSLEFPDGTNVDEADLARSVSVQAAKLVPGLKEKNLRVRITTPDGRSWDLPSFYVEDRDTKARYGWGTASLLIMTDGKIFPEWRSFAPWSD